VIVERHAADGRRARAVHTDAADEGCDLRCDRWARISALERAQAVAAGCAERTMPCGETR